jgi:hypothetical protein
MSTQAFAVRQDCSSSTAALEGDVYMRQTSTVETSKDYVARL